MPATTSKPITGPEYPSWSRPTAGDGRDQMNVGGLRAKSADSAAIAPVAAYLRRPDGTRVRLVLAAVESGREEMAVVVELPAGVTLARG